MGTYLIKTYASVKRIDDFLNEEEVPEWVSWQCTSRVEPRSSSTLLLSDDERVGFENDASFEWVSEVKEERGDTETRAEVVDGHKNFTLKKINVEFKIGQMNLIAGRTGSGKSSRESQ